MKIPHVLVIFCVIAVTTSDNFVHLCGYSFFADYFAHCVASDALTCAAICNAASICGGFRFEPKTNTCYLFTLIRSSNPGQLQIQCEYHIRSAPTTTVKGRNLTEVDQLIQNIAYSSQGRCPDYWEMGTGNCTLDTFAQTCKEYAPFFEATFDNGTCTIPLLPV
uniref:Apple domain-containing protein n=1 Tax=Panagrellus redivivus TaxID=6233 RepID=A0A7E4V4P3_PANRE